jgi:hypothetical protein
VKDLRQQQQVLQAAKGQKLALFGQHAQLRALVDRNKAGFKRVSVHAAFQTPCRPMLIAPLIQYRSLTPKHWWCCQLSECI